MGMFDYVDFEFYCSKCGEKVEEFQTKTSCVLGDDFRLPELSTFQPWEVEDFYGDCPCGMFYRFENKKVFPRIEPPNWKMHVNCTEELKGSFVRSRPLKEWVVCNDLVVLNSEELKSRVPKSDPLEGVK